GEAGGMACGTWIIAPLCDNHRWHWAVRAVAVPGSFLAFNAVYFAGLLTLLDANPGFDAPEWLLLGGAGALIAWILLVVMLHRTAIRVRELTGGGLVVNGVADDFIEALEKHRQSRECDKWLTLEGADRARRLLRLYRDEVDFLPELCICCGEPAATTVA